MPGTDDTGSCSGRGKSRVSGAEPRGWRLPRSKQLLEAEYGIRCRAPGLDEDPTRAAKREVRTPRRIFRSRSRKTAAEGRWPAREWLLQFPFQQSRLPA